MNLFARAGLLSGLVLLTPLGCNPGGRPDLSAGVRHILNNNILNNNIFNNNILNNNLLTNDYFNFRAARAAFFQAPAVPASTRTINLLSVDDSTHTVAGTDISFSGVSTFDLINLWTKSAFCMGPSGQPYSIQVDGVERNTTTGAFGLASLAIADDDMVDLFLACTGAHANIESVAISINGHHRDGSQWTVVTPTEDEAIAFPRPEAFFTAHRDSSSGDIHWYITLRLTDLEQMYMNEMMRYYTLRVDPSITPHLLRTCADAILRRRTDPSVVIPLECGGDKLIERNGLLVRASGGPNPYSSSEHFCEDSAAGVLGLDPSATARGRVAATEGVRCHPTLCTTSTSYSCPPYHAETCQPTQTEYWDDQPQVGGFDVNLEPMTGAQRQAQGDRFLNAAAQGLLEPDAGVTEAGVPPAMDAAREATLDAGVAPLVGADAQVAQSGVAQ